MIYQADREWRVGSYASLKKIYGNLWVSFCLNTGKRFFVEVLFKANRKALGSSKKTVLGIFQTALRLWYQYIFMLQSLEILNIFNALTLK